LNKKIAILMLNVYEILHLSNLFTRTLIHLTYS